MLLSSSFRKTWSKDTKEKTYLYCQLRRCTVGINMSNSGKHILLILRLFFTKHFHIILRKKTWSAHGPHSGLTHPDFNQQVVWAYAEKVRCLFLVTKHALLLCKLQRKNAVIQKPTSECVNWLKCGEKSFFGKDCLLRPKPVLLREGMLSVSLFPTRTFLYVAYGF